MANFIGIAWFLGNVLAMNDGVHRQYGLDSRSHQRY